MVRVVKERAGVELGTTTASMFIKAKGIPFIGGKCEPKGNGGRGKAGPRGPRRPREETGGVERKRPGTIHERTGAEDRTMYSSPYAPTMLGETTFEWLGGTAGGLNNTMLFYGPSS